MESKDHLPRTLLQDLLYAEKNSLKTVPRNLVLFPVPCKPIKCRQLLIDNIPRFQSEGNVNLYYWVSCVNDLLVPSRPNPDWRGKKTASIFCYLKLPVHSRELLVSNSVGCSYRIMQLILEPGYWLLVFGLKSEYIGCSCTTKKAELVVTWELRKSSSGKDMMMLSRSLLDSFRR